jgi:flagellar biosynthesis/type III secretory pathway protein FliH
LKEYEKEADAIVCNLWDEVRAEGKEEGKEEGRAEGKVEGRIEGRAEGKVEGRIEGRAEEIVSMGTDFDLPKEEIIAKLQEKLQIDLHQAEEYYNVYSKDPAVV